MNNNRGISPLGLCHPKYDVKNLIRAFEGVDEIRFGWIDNFFNPNDSKNARRVCDLPSPKWCRVHIINGPGMNNNRTCSHEITFGETTASVQNKVMNGNAKFLNAFEKRVRHVAAVTANARAGGMDFCLSPWLEHKVISQACFARLASICKQVIPEARIVDNPVEGGFFPGYLHEKHSDNPGPPNTVDIVDMDGTAWESMDVVAWGQRYANCRAALIWNYGDNGNTKEPGFTHPFKRVAWTGSRDMRVYRCWVRPDALVENNSFNQGDLQGLKPENPSDGYKRDFVWKLGDGRNYAVCLLPRSMNGADIKGAVVKRNGVIIDTGRRRGAYTEDGTNRHIIDFTKHTDSFPDNCVLSAAGHGWRLRLPQFRID